MAGSSPPAARRRSAATRAWSRPISACPGFRPDDTAPYIGNRGPARGGGSAAVSEALLTLAGLAVAYGPVSALEGVSLEVNRGEVVALLGANGAGKSTLIKAVMGFLVPQAGRMTLAGWPLDGLAVERRARLGISYCPE